MSNSAHQQNGMKMLLIWCCTSRILCRMLAFISLNYPVIVSNTIHTFSWGVLLSLGANNPLNMALKLISVTMSWKELFSGS